MHPVILHFGAFKLPAYGLMVAAGYLAAIYYIFSRAAEAGFKKENLSDLVFYSVLSGMIGAKFFYAVTYWDNFGADLLSRAAYVLRTFQYGFVFYGGLIFGAAAFYLAARRRGMNPLTAADLCAPALALGHAFGRVGCFLAGCCHGAPASGFPFSVVFTNPSCEVAPALLGVPLYPTQLIEAAGNIIIFSLLHRALGKKRAAGSVIALYAALYSVQRFLIEFLRGDDRGVLRFGLSPAQLISAAAFAAAVILFFGLKAQNEKN
ncbi:MAG TPA: prolipoprotein diacylglyceryl transferase [Elusimicrobia bacterium]|nr:prolipoprotein diacylglyceryl transferase [Elusimicrobiota bacterium]